MTCLHSPQRALQCISLACGHDSVPESCNGRQRKSNSALFAHLCCTPIKSITTAQCCIRHSMQVIKALQQQQMLQAAGGIEGLVALLQTSPGDASTQQTTTLVVYCQTYHTGLEAKCSHAGCEAVHNAKPSCCYAHRACLDCAGSAGTCTRLSMASMQPCQVNPFALHVHPACIICL